MRILGFDFRSNHCAQWSNQRRDQYLLKPDVTFPLSVDDAVWESLFRFDEEVCQKSSQYICLAPNDFHQQGLGLWANLLEIQKAIKCAGLSLKDGSLICITLETTEFIKDEKRWEMAFGEPTLPSDLDQQWELKGYDVADNFFISSVSNCGYGTEEIKQLRAKWQDSINSNGLFRSIALAKEFREYANSRIASHAPFYIFGLHHVRVSPRKMT